MKRSPMPRGTKPLARRAELTNGSQPGRTAQLKPRSKKTEQRYRIRRVLVAELLEQRPWCEIRWDDRCQQRSVDVDEILSRGRGGDYCDPDNCQTACRPCHDAKHKHSIEAVQRGVSRNSWGAGAAA
jgi:5-methylcytosine-specific restriction endonuclease McrA